MDPPDKGLVLKVVDPPLHKSVPLLLAIVGAAGVEAVVIVAGLDSGPAPQALDSCTV